MLGERTVGLKVVQSDVMSAANLAHPKVDYLVAQMDLMAATLVVM